jgi:hypothetical protein
MSLHHLLPCPKKRKENGEETDDQIHKLWSNINLLDHGGKAIKMKSDGMRRCRIRVSKWGLVVLVCLSWFLACSCIHGTFWSRCYTLDKIEEMRQISCTLF